MCDQFYITLPSNTLEENTASNFRNVLPQRIRLEGEWEVGLAEIIYPHAWLHIDKENSDIVFISISDRIGVGVYMKKGYYENITSLVEMINNQIENFDDEAKFVKDVKFKIDDSSRKVVMVKNKSKVKYIDLTPRLTSLLGFEKDILYDVVHENIEEKHETDEIEIYAKYDAASTNTFFESMYVYCNIIEDQMIGNIMAPLLRIVDIQGKHGDVICKTYDAPHYMPVLLKDIVQIEINLKTDIDELFSFKFGKVVVKLHVRRRNGKFPIAIIIVKIFHTVKSVLPKEIHTIYTPESADYWLKLYQDSLDSQQYQIGGLRGFRAFAPYHRGGGLGSFFQSLFRYAMPLLKTAGKHALITGSKVVADVTQGRNLQESLKEHGKAATSSFLHETSDNIGQRGKGRRKRSYKRKSRRSNASVASKKRRRAVGTTNFGKHLFTTK